MAISGGGTPIGSGARALSARRIPGCGVGGPGAIGAATCTGSWWPSTSVSVSPTGSRRATAVRPANGWSRISRCRSSAPPNSSGGSSLMWRSRRFGCDRHMSEEPPEEFGGALDRHLDILDHPFAGRTAVALLDPVGDTETLVEGHQLPVHVAAPIAPGPPTPHPGILRAERARAPEPIGVPPPEIAMHRQPVFFDAGVMLDGPVVDVLPGVIADRAGGGGTHSDAQVALLGAEDHCVEVVDRHAVKATGLDDAVHRCHQFGQRVKPHMPQCHERLGGLQLDANSGRIT